MKLPFCKIMFKYFHFPAPFYPTKLNRPVRKAQNYCDLRLRATTMHGIAACERTPMYTLDGGMGLIARH
jgi:hypothetical protein